MRSAMTMTFLKLILVTFAVSPMAFAQSSDSDTGTEAGLSYVVIKLQYATAEELAPVLAAVAPPGVRITAYPPTNSLIISGDPAIIGTLKAKDAD